MLKKDLLAASSALAIINPGLPALVLGTTRSCSH